ncbi:Sushi, von Willebrand factor type A, EGF and pentraxin domain-containing protein 1 [Holothuria leucospilota]|uniref:Sushi, von Willebrand factor type A, EGF and pentraxin domain-containing protein 1 n=1 Tax=Holothuria leucospilota TaxID=206669 RepID=A0A9Q1HES0_HOLLE|nr:Sushi, von Willebrand factor type A, EGF and pentraxin domain-containing protein 1 [Holothuria leucospilota]
MELLCYLEHRLPRTCSLLRFADCLLDCVNGGTLIETDRECRCECARGWQGDQCDTICLDDEVCEEASGHRYSMEQCLTEDYVFNKCPVLCQRCAKFGPGAPGFECSLECLHGGVLVNNGTNCFCKCPEEWSGIKCEVHAELPRTEDEMRREKGMADGGYQMTGPGIELVFLLDTSASVGGVMFKKQKQILLGFIDSLDFDAEGGIRALFLAFDSNTRLGRNLYDIHSREDARKSLESIQYEGGQSKLTSALRTARQLVFAHARENAKKIFYIFSDGLYTGDRPVKFSQAMRATGVEVGHYRNQIFALVMEQEGYNAAVLTEMTGDLDHIITVNSFNDIPLPYGHNDNITFSPSMSPRNK